MSTRCPQELGPLQKWSDFWNTHTYFRSGVSDVLGAEVGRADSAITELSLLQVRRDTKAIEGDKSCSVRECDCERAWSSRVRACVGQGRVPHSSGTCHARTLSSVDSGDRHVTPRASWLVPCQGEDYNDHCLQQQENHPGLTSYSLESAEVPLSIIDLASFCLEHEYTDKSVSVMLYYMEFVWFSWFGLPDLSPTVN